MDSLANYGSDDDYEDNSREKLGRAGRSDGSHYYSPEEADVNYDEVQMDLSEESNNNNSNEEDDRRRERSPERRHRRERTRSSDDSRTSELRPSDMRSNDYRPKYVETDYRSNDPRPSDARSSERSKHKENHKSKYDEDRDRSRKYDEDRERSKRNDEDKSKKYDEDKPKKCDEDRSKKYEEDRSKKYDENRTKKYDEDRPRKSKYDHAGSSEKKSSPKFREDHNSKERGGKRYKRSASKERKRSTSRDRKRSSSRERKRSRSPRRFEFRRRSNSKERNRGNRFGKRFDRTSNKMAQLEKLGIEIKTPDAEFVTPQMLLQRSVNEQVNSGAGVELHKYYNPLAMNPARYADQIQKRRLLWQHKEKPETQVQSKPGTTMGKVWQSTTFAQDSDGKVASKFKRLMGIKEPVAAPGVKDSSRDVLKRQEEMFSSMEQQYEVARTATHTMRGVGLGFGSYQYPR